jgi:hypothetical protein
MTTEEAIQTILSAVAPRREPGDDGLPSIMQAILDMHIRCLIDNRRLPEIKHPYSQTTIDTIEGIKLVTAIEHILPLVRAEGVKA